MYENNTRVQQDFLVAANNLLDDLTEKHQSYAYKPLIKLLKKFFDENGNWVGTIPTQPDYNAQRINEAKQRLESRASDTVNEWLAQRNEKYGYTLLMPVAYLPDPNFVPVDRDYVESHIWPNRYEQDDIWMIFDLPEHGCTNVLIRGEKVYCSTRGEDYESDFGAFDSWRDSIERDRWPNRISQDDIRLIAVWRWNVDSTPSDPYHNVGFVFIGDQVWHSDMDGEPERYSVDFEREKTREYWENELWPNRYSLDDVVLIGVVTSEQHPAYNKCYVYFADDGYAGSSIGFSEHHKFAHADMWEQWRWPNRISMDDVLVIESEPLDFLDCVHVNVANFDSRFGYDRFCSNSQLLAS